MSTMDKIEKSIVLRASRSRVWRALTDSQEFGSWFRAEIEGKFEVGATVKARSLYPGHEHQTWQMRVEEMVPESFFAFIWPQDAEAKDLSNSNRVEFRLEEVPEGTRLTMVESGFDRMPEDRRMTVWRDNDQGWTLQMENIARHVEG